MVATGFQRVSERAALIRLTALWALHEAAIAGVLHFFKIPFSGLFMAGGAIVLVSLIAYVAKDPSREITKAMMVVMLIKLTLSPHAPITAYIAVGFQGLMGTILFRIFPYRSAALLFGVIGMMETALQKLLTLTLFFGRSLWSSLDLFVESVMQRLGLQGDASYSLRIVIFYLAIYAISGVLVGILSGWLPRKVEQRLDHLELVPIGIDHPGSDPDTDPNKIMIPWVLIMILGSLIGAYYIFPGAVHHHPLFLIARVIFVILLWFLIVSPFLIRLLRKFLQSRESEYGQDVNSALGLLPSFRTLVVKAWKESATKKGWARYPDFLGNAIAYCILYEYEQGT